MDKSTLIAVVLVFVSWLAWDAYMRKKYPPLSAPPSSSEASDKAESVHQTEPLKKKKQINKKNSQAVKTFKKQPEQLFSFESPELSFVLSSKGMALKRIILNKVRDNQNQKVKLFDDAAINKNSLHNNKLPFETRFSGELKPLDFKIKQTSPNKWEGKAFVESKGVQILKTFLVDPKQFVIETKVVLKGKINEGMQLETFLVQQESVQNQKTSFLDFYTLPDLLSLFISSKSGSQLEIFPSDKDSRQDFLSSVQHSGLRAIAMGYKYFGLALIDKSPVQAQFSMEFLRKQWVGILKHRVLSADQEFSLSYQSFMGPKVLKLLKKNYPELVDWVDFGWFGGLARFILEILSFFHSIAGNWGFSIILLTLLVRFLLLPLVLSSHRSMEVMKKIQPELQKIKEKFKKDPQRMNQEVMALMKSHRANPLGGCLPMLLQVPVFWALWKALSNSYSLYNSPFVFWIQDLSQKDPFYVLPVLIGIAMFVQQKLSPVVGSKEIAQAMKILPVIMVVFMINLPSGLTLYVLISSLFGLAQQWYLNTQRKLKSV